MEIISITMYSVGNLAVCIIAGSLFGVFLWNFCEWEIFYSAYYFPFL